MAWYLQDAVEDGRGEDPEPGRGQESQTEGMHLRRQLGDCSHLHTLWQGLPIPGWSHQSQQKLFQPRSYCSSQLGRITIHGQHGPTEAYYSYSIPEGTVHSFPVTIGADRQYSIVEGLQIGDFSSEKMDATAKELLNERHDAFSFLDQQE